MAIRGRPFNSWGRGGGRLDDFWSSRIFFLAIWSAGYFFPVSFLLHLCCMQFFSSDKRLQKIFFKINPPPLSRVKWSAPKIKKTANPDDLLGNTQSKLSFYDWCISMLSSKKCQTPIILADFLGNESLLQRVNFWDRESAIKCPALAELSFPHACYLNL